MFTRLFCSKQIAFHFDNLFDFFNLIPSKLVVSTLLSGRGPHRSVLPILTCSAGFDRRENLQTGSQTVIRTV